METTTPATSHPGRASWLKRALVGALLHLLAGSLVCNVLLFRQADKDYREVNEVRLDPYGLKHTFFPSESEASEVVFFGDSRAQQWPAPQAGRLRFLNRGLFGQTTEQVLHRYESQVRPLHPKIVVLQAGINDLKAIGIFPNRRDEIVADCKRNLHEIIDRATADGSRVIVTTIFPTGSVPPQRWAYWSPQIDAAVVEVNNDMKSIQNDRVTSLDAWNILQANGKLRPEYARDTLHLTPAGNEALARELVGDLNSARE